MYTLCYEVIRNSLENRFSNLASIYVLSRLFGILNGAANCRAYSRFSAMAAQISTSSPNGDANMHSDPQRTYQVVVAATRDMGIGKDGKLPWNLPSDLKFFKELTTSTVDPKKKNALIMGRKTWQSIPRKYRPLPGRLNVVLTRSGNLDIDTAVNVVLCGSIALAMELLTQPPYSQSIEKVFVVGGGQILKEALNAPQCDAIHITEIETSIDCDTFIPPIDFSMFRPWYSSLPLVENNIRFSFVTYVRVRSSTTELHTSISGVKSCSSSNSVMLEVKSFRFLPKIIFDRHEENSYLSLVQEIISSGTQKNNSKGSDTLTKFGCQMRFNLRRSFPLLTSKRVSWQNVVEKLLWCISGSTNVKIGNTGIWDPFVDSREDNFVPGQGFDKLSDVVDKIGNGVDDKLVVFSSSWNPSDLEMMALPTCLTFAQFHVANGELSCQMYEHSADMGLGVSFNIASYALLTCMIAHACGLTPGDFVHIIGDAYLCRTHISSLQEQLRKLPRPLPTLKINPKKKDIRTFEAADFELIGYDPHN